MLTEKEPEKLARVEEREAGTQKVFVVVLSTDSGGREKDLRSFCVDNGARHDPMRQKALRFAERVNTAAESFAQSRVDEAVKPLVEALKVYARRYEKNGECWNWRQFACDKQSGQVAHFDFEGGEQNEPWEIAEKALEKFK
jgi:hypothetical protein